MAIAKNTTPGKLTPDHRATILEKEKNGLTPAKTASDRQDIGSTSTQKRAITVLESTGEEPIIISPELRQRMIRDAAYFRSEQRGFVGGDPMQDWIEAEAEIAHMLGETRLSERKNRRATH